jgi:hypothetical protein
MTLSRVNAEPRLRVPQCYIGAPDAFNNRLRRRHDQSRGIYRGSTMRPWNGIAPWRRRELTWNSCGSSARPGSRDMATAMAADALGAGGLRHCRGNCIEITNQRRFVCKLSAPAPRTPTAPQPRKPPESHRIRPPDATEGVTARLPAAIQRANNRRPLRLAGGRAKRRMGQEIGAGDWGRRSNASGRCSMTTLRLGADRPAGIIRRRDSPVPSAARVTLRGT